MGAIRRQGRRFAWLMAGAAIGLAVVLLVAVVAVLPGGGVTALTGPLGLLVGAVSLLLAALLGLVPGVRELEVTGARSMLGADGELLLPRRPRPAHHLQTGSWVALHLMTGLVVAALLVTFVPTAVLYLVELVLGEALGSGVPLPGTAAGRLGAGGLAVLIGVLSLLAWWPLGAGLARLAPRLLGPTTADRLELVRQRAEREAERTRLARELHDGIGHALTVVSVQAAAARAVQSRDPQAAAAALAAIEDTARDATGELDAVLALLREEERGARGAGSGSDNARPTGSGPRSQEPARPPTDPPPGDLDQLLRDRERAGMDLRTRIELPPHVAPIQHRHLERCLAELLTNAQRHGGPGPVEVTLTERAGRLRLEVTSPLPAPTDHAPAPAPVGGRGLQGLRERVAQLGGTVEAGAHGEHWRVRLDLPLLTEETRR